MSTALTSMSFEDVAHHYPAKDGDLIPTLRGVSIDVAAQEFITIVGPSGCGKSTLFNLASGLLKPSSGTVKVNGHPLQAMNPYVAYMFQHHGLLEWRTVLDNAILGQEFLGISKRQARREALRLLEVFGLGSRTSARTSSPAA
jgi:ABC-type nitrate/sulfonate/bicarbonate transport system ATPase subunit